MKINHAPEHYEEHLDKDTSQTTTSTSRAGILMPWSARLTGSED